MCDSCPDHDVLVGVVSGKLPDEGGCMEHVKSCDACKAYLDALPDLRPLLPEEKEPREPNMAVFEALMTERQK